MDSLLDEARILLGEPYVKMEKIRQVRSERITRTGDVLSYQPKESTSIGLYVMAEAISPEHSYFEMEILDTGRVNSIGLGLVPNDYRLNRMPGWDTLSIAYHADDGCLFKARGTGQPLGPKCNRGDIMGCGIKFESVGPRKAVDVYFTRNGRELGTFKVPWPDGGLFPAVGMHSIGESVQVDMSAEWEGDGVLLMPIADIIARYT